MIQKQKEEWLDGKRYVSQMPSPNHNHILNELHLLIANYLRGKSCELFRENVDLILLDPTKATLSDIKSGKNHTKVQPDLAVFCKNPYEVSGNNIIGIPDFIIEILSPGSIKLDKETKKAKYLALGVKEYWIVDCYGEEVLKYFAGQAQSLGFADAIKVETFESLSIDFSTLNPQKYLFD